MKSLRTEKKVYFKSVISVTRHNSRHMFSCVDENNELKRMIVGLNVNPDAIYPVACMHDLFNSTVYLFCGTWTRVFRHFLVEKIHRFLSDN